MSEWAFDSYSSRTATRPPGAEPPSEPSSSTLAELLGTLDPVVIWNFDESSTTVWTDEEAAAGGTWTTPPAVLRPTLIDAGYSTEFTGGTWGEVTTSAPFVLAAGTISFFIVFQSVAEKQAIMNRWTGDAGDGGRFLVELLAGGQISVKLATADGSIVHNILSAPSAIAKGVTYHIAVRWGSGGLRLYIDGTFISSEPSLTTGVQGTRETHIGAWYSGGSGPFSGLLCCFSWHDRELTPTEIAAIAEYSAGNVIWCNDDDAGSIGSGETRDWAVADNDIWAGSTPDVQIVSQPASGTFAVQANKTIRITPDAAGAQSGTYRIGSTAAAATLSFTALSGSSGWTPTLFYPPPGGFGFSSSNIIASHPTMEMTQAIIDANYNTVKEGVYPWRRLNELASGPGGLPCIQDEHDANEHLQPMGHDFFDMPMAMEDYRYLCLLGHLYSEVNWGVEGKYWMLNGGRGWIGTGYSKPSGSYGTDGFGHNLMHPKIGSYGGPNCTGMLSSHTGQSSAQGSQGTRTNTPIPLDQWNAMAVVVDLGSSANASDGAYYIYMNGVQSAYLTGIRIAQSNITGMDRIWSRFRPMSGGNPESLNTYHNAGKHYHGGFYLYAVAR